MRGVGVIRGRGGLGADLYVLLGFSFVQEVCAGRLFLGKGDALKPVGEQ